MFLVFITGCIAQFTPEISENQDLLVVEGLLTDQCGPNTVKISTSLPLGGRNEAKPLSGCSVSVTDNLGNIIKLEEADAGNYLTPLSFQGQVGRFYTLTIKANRSAQIISYQSDPVELKPVPPIDSLYYEKQVITSWEGAPSTEGCQIFLNTHDPENICKFFRWDFSETWDFRLPYQVLNNHCWITKGSDNLFIKSTASLTEARILRLPINYISNETDRLKEKYSILVNQYSLGENEYLYWEKLQNVTQNVGSLYDMTPASIPGNISCIEKPGEKVLGYFSVSAVKSKRIFIKDYFRGMPDLYELCPNAGAPLVGFIPGLGSTVWVIIVTQFPPSRTLTYFKGCADCTARGTTEKPAFWPDDN